MPSGETAKGKEPTLPPRSRSEEPGKRVTLEKKATAVSRSLPSLTGKVIRKVEKKKRRKTKNQPDEVNIEEINEPEINPARKIQLAQEKRASTIWRNLALLLLLFAYSLLGGVLFSAIEGGNEQKFLLQKFEKNAELYRKRRNYQHIIFRRFKDIQEMRYTNLKRGETLEDIKLEMVREAVTWYETKMGFQPIKPIMESSRWNIWGGIYYAASLYTTIGYGNFHPKTTSGRIISMLYAFVGIPLVGMILLEWGFLYFTWIESAWSRFNQYFCQSRLQHQLDRRNRRERLRRMGSDLTLGTSSSLPFLAVNRSQPNTTDHQMESSIAYDKKDSESVEEEEQVKTVPMKAALFFFILWLCLAAFVVRLWESEWSYFTAFYFFFTSLTTIGLGDVVTKTPNFILFNLALTMIGLSVVGLCMAIVQAKVRMVYDRMIRSIDSQYRIRQIDADVAVMSLIKDENDGIKRLSEAQRMQERLVFAVMDEHRKSLLRERWKRLSRMVNRQTQTYPKREDKMVQTGNRVFDQPKRENGEDSEVDHDYDEEDEEEEELDERGNPVITPSTKRYIYTVFD